MKLIHRSIVGKNMSGKVVLLPENGEDMWHAYNIIQPKDQLRASTVRKITLESSTGSVGSNRVRTMLTVSVETLDFDFQACVLRVKGRNIEENKYVKMGAYHTLDLEMNRKFTLIKEEWDTIVLDRIDSACDPAQNADVSAVVMQEGLAHICLVLASMTIVRAKIEMNIPRKNKGHADQHDRAIEKFFASVFQAIVRHINFDIVKCVLIASPGFVKDQFYEYMNLYAIKHDNRIIIDNKAKFLLVHSSSGYKHSLSEVINDPTVVARLSDTKAMGEIRALEQFNKMLLNEPDRAYYGLKQVQTAANQEAIDTLMVCDSFLRPPNVKQRKELANLLDHVRNQGGNVKVFSSLHVSGEKLSQLTGIAAILRFPMPDISDDDSSDDD